jgi:hypothetical protein
MRVKKGDMLPKVPSCTIQDETAQETWMNYPSYTEAVADGAINLRQNIQLLDNAILSA